jgi:hypothetical protein
MMDTGVPRRPPSSPSVLAEHVSLEDGSGWICASLFVFHGSDRPAAQTGLYGTGRAAKYSLDEKLKDSWPRSKRRDEKQDSFFRMETNNRNIRKIGTVPSIQLGLSPYP